MLAEEARRGSRRCCCSSGSAGISADAADVDILGVPSSVPPGSASISVTLNPRPKSREERSDGHALQSERGAHLPGTEKRFREGREDSKEKSIERASDVHVRRFFFSSLGRFRLFSRLKTPPRQHCQPEKILLVLEWVVSDACRTAKSEREWDGEGRR